MVQNTFMLNFQLKSACCTLGSTTYNKPHSCTGSAVSNVEANAIIGELSAYQPDTRITLSIANNPGGNVEILDAETKLVLYTDPVRSVRHLIKCIYFQSTFCLCTV